MRDFGYFLVALLLSVLLILFVQAVAFPQDTPGTGEVINNPDCLIIAPDWLTEGAQQWCNTGVFLEVRASGNKVKKLFHSKMSLNGLGYAAFTEKEDKFRAAFIELLVQFNDYAIDATLDLYFGDAWLLKCRSMPAPLCENAG
jgi:hypothetical protein